MTARKDTPPQSMSDVVIERDPDEARTFANLLARLEEGQLDSDLTALVADVVSRLRDVARDQGGKPSAEISLKIKLKLDDGLIETRHEIGCKLPKETRMRTLWWPTDSNTLTARNPRQRNLPFGVADITVGAGRVRDVTA